MSNPTDDHPFSTFAAELSRNLAPVTRLLAEHPATGDCTGCRLPGARVAVKAPCGVRAVAALALTIRAAEEAQQGA
ncbi:MAG: hypothetical protein QOK35_3052 [Pseudonocardiales bacterium]|nr:hypothetical protein [Pseudonocardiales bacterium]